MQGMQSPIMVMSACPNDQTRGTCLFPAATIARRFL
jgi:hypothetical protein